MTDNTSSPTSLLDRLDGTADVSPALASAVVESAERALTGGGDVAPGDWHAYLDRTRRPAFLLALPDRTWRERWAATTFAAVRASGYDLATLLQQRVQEHPDRTLFRELAEGQEQDWSYRRVCARCEAIAAVLRPDPRSAPLHSGGAGERERRLPRVVILAENSVSGACTDLACLVHGLPVAPLDIHFDVPTLAWICERLEADVAVTDTPEHAARLEEVRSRLDRPLRLLVLREDAALQSPVAEILDAAAAELPPMEVRRRLQAIPRPSLDEAATVMFTSGSTGRPKGVVFSGYNLVTKRFARAAALPAVGQGELLLCYLPLYHTFGRYLEMMGMLFWGGTYVFATDPSAEALLAQLPRVRPTGLVSIPLRWQQIWSRCLSRAGEAAAPQDQRKALREIVGERLRWGISAAGYLEPRVFRYFHRQGVTLCSGFGMTEATGGITMTPPDDYRDGSVGLPLPGVRARFGADGELQIAGPYVARYLEEAEPPSLTPPLPAEEKWLATGDLFQQGEGGHLSIVDRIKDIYKNSRGQTVAPRRVEDRFVDVPGIRRTFLVGDGRDHNTLLIVPDPDDPVLAGSDDDKRQEYFSRIVTAVNEQLASYERVVDFAVLERDFSLERGELTPKGSYRRKVLEDHFQPVIAELYRQRQVELVWDRYRLSLPHWLYRDLGILITDLVVQADGLQDRSRRLQLELARAGGDGLVRIGDLAYRLRGDHIDLGALVRQPLLWAGNPALTRFFRCKEGWHTDLGDFSEQVVLPPDHDPEAARREPPRIGHRVLAAVHLLSQEALFDRLPGAAEAVTELAARLNTAGEWLGRLIRRRLEALAFHPELAVRCRAYQVLLLDEPMPDYDRFLPTFIESGLPFLCEESIGAIASSRLEPRRLQAFRQRLQSYRVHLEWPASETTRGVFTDLFRLLADFVRYHPEYYAPIREELVTWVLHDGDPELSRRAREEFDALAKWYEERQAVVAPPAGPEAWEGRLAFQDGLSADEIDRLRQVLVSTTFLTQSVALACPGESFELAEIGPGGIWISRILSWREYSRYRLSINTSGGSHLDLQIVIREDLDQDWVRETIYWLIAIHGAPLLPPMVPRFGCCRPELGAFSMDYSSDLTLWERIRQFSSGRGQGTPAPSPALLRKLFVRAMAAFFAGWQASGGRILPGAVTPSNVIVPEPDFREGSRIQSLTGWRRYEGPVSLVWPLVHNFYRQTASHYPWCRSDLELAWIFDACLEPLGLEAGGRFLAELAGAADLVKLETVAPGLTSALAAFRQGLRERYRPPLAVECAIERYAEWERVNTQATPAARLELLEELQRLYRLDRYGDLARYTLFRHTYFRHASPSVQDGFARLATRMFRQPERSPRRMVELSDLQDALADPDDRIAFRRLVFPHGRGARQLELATIGDTAGEQVVVRSRVTDRQGVSYQVSEPTSAGAIGQVYRLFLQMGYPKSISPLDRFLVLSNQQEQIIGGVCYRIVDEQMVHLDGLVVTPSLRDRALSSALLEDFCSRLADQGYRAVRTHFFLRAFYQHRGFRTDRRWGGLVRFLAE